MTALNKVYDGKTDATVVTSGATLTGLVSGDSVTVSNAKGVFTDKNVGAAKTVQISNLTLSGGDAGNYATSGSSTTKADITLRPLSTWTAAAGGQWSAAGNWDALPDGSNVLAVSIPAGAGVIVYDGGAGNTTLQSLSSGRTLSMGGGSLQVGDFDSIGFVQSDGSVSAVGSFRVIGDFNQSGGSINASSIGVVQRSGTLTFSNIGATTVSLSAVTGAITQTGPVVSSGLTTESATGTILNGPGKPNQRLDRNQFWRWQY
ncbi:MAG: hypothetical protein IPG23_19275 [Burkholderiales bacterium]|nr:hypothetical protein [Burkholderiales bacterium]